SKPHSLPSPLCFRPMLGSGAKPSMPSSKSWQLAERPRRRTRRGCARLVGSLGSQRKATLFASCQIGGNLREKAVTKEPPTKQRLTQDNDHAPEHRDRCHSKRRLLRASAPEQV